MKYVKCVQHGRLPLHNYTMHESSKFVIDTGVKFSNLIKYRKIMGKLLYLVNTRPNISYFVRVFIRFMQLHQNSHIDDAKNVIPYLEGEQLSLGLSLVEKVIIQFI